MSRDILPRLNVGSNNIKSTQITSTSMRSLLNTNNTSLNLSHQPSDQSSLLLSRFQNTSNTVVLQDASTGKSATVHLKKIPITTASDISAPQIAQIQYVPSTKGPQIPTPVSQGRPQIVYIKGCSSSINNTLLVRPPMQYLNKNMIKSINKIPTTKIVSNSECATTKTAGASSGNSDNSICFVSTLKTSTSIANKELQPLIVTASNTAPSTNNQKVLLNSVNALPKFQKSNIGYTTSTPQMQSKGPILNFQISDGKINEETITVSSGNEQQDSEKLEMPALKSIQCNTKDAMKSNIYDHNKMGSFLEDGNFATPELKTNFNSNSMSLKQAVHSVLRRNSISKINYDNNVKTEINSPENHNYNINNDTDVCAKSNDKPISMLKPQPRIKKQQLQIKEDFQEVCIEFLNPNANERKKKINKATSRKPDYEKLTDPMQNLIWKNDIGTLDNTNLHFRKNEFGLYDLLSVMEYDALITGRKDSMYCTPLAKRVEIQDNVRMSKSADDLYECLSCASLGPAIEFISPEFCSTVCADEFKEQKREQILKRESEINNKLHKASPMIPSERSDEEDSDESDIDDDIQNSLYPWMHSKHGFSWSRYMSFKKTKPAPLKLFKEPFPYHTNGFKIGMKLEAIDPHHESYICVVSVVDIKGYRICLHFDSYPSKYDFWVNADSIDIFPAGWCEKNDHLLRPPKYFTPESFIWANYLKQCKAVAAPKTLFPHASSEAVCPHGFRVGMKLEALDRKNSNKMCVATVADILFPQRFLVHFDDWDEMYDYWADATSPYIHPVGWCEDHAETLIPPSGYGDKKDFSWHEYLKETNSVAAPARAFKGRSVSGFRIGMKIEAVDIRVPYLVRVATVADVKAHSIKVSFDGWPPRYSFWVDDDNPDIHPVGWCSKTGHSLEPPLMPEDVQSTISLGCGIPGCTGLGNVNDPQQLRHHKVDNCPYALNNLNIRSEIGFDRLQHLDTNEVPERILPYSKLASKRSSTECHEKSAKQYKSTTESSCNEDSIHGDDLLNSLVKFEPVFDNTNTLDSGMENNFIQDNQFISDQPIKQELELDVKTSVFKPGYLPDPVTGVDHSLWSKYTQPLSYLIKKSYKGHDPRLWTCSDVVKFVSNIPNCSDYAHTFEEQDIDGECFVMLTQRDLIAYCDLRIGPAIKIYNSIMVLREQMSS